MTPCPRPGEDLSYQFIAIRLTILTMVQRVSAFHNSLSTCRGILVSTLESTLGQPPVFRVLICLYK